MSNDKVRVRGISIFRPIIYGNAAVLLTPEEKSKGSYPPDHTHRWTVAVRSAASTADTVGGADDLGYFIKRVTFKLHDTYPNPNRNIDKPPFEVSETGWGEFEIQIRINFISEAGEKGMLFYHHLKLHPWAPAGEPEIPPPEVALKLGPVHSWQYDEIVFNDPFQHFLNILTAHPPTPIPTTNTRKRPVPFHTTHPQGLEASRGPGIPEFTRDMERDEAGRLEEAKKKVLEEQQKLKSTLMEKERQLENLRRRLNN